MQQVVSITSQGQLTIPKRMRDAFALSGSVKAVVSKKGRKIIVEPRMDFWGLEGVLKSKVRLSDQDLKNARKSFSKDWAKK